MQLDPKLLPDIVTLRHRSQALAMLDAIVCPEWEDRYYSFNKNWGEGEQMGSMRNGSGDDWFIHFGPFGAAIKGLAHETSIAGDKVFVSEIQRQVPQAFSSFLADPAFGMDWASYCYWRGDEDAGWSKVIHPDPEFLMADDGSSEYLAILIEPASAYMEFVKWYFEIDLPLAAIQSIYEHSPLTDELLMSINAAMTIDTVREFAEEIGYPLAHTEP